MELKFNGFAGCCGAGILFGFPLDSYRHDSTFERHIKLQEATMEKYFRPTVGKGSEEGIMLTNVSFIHAVLNSKQMLSEPMLLKHGFRVIDESVNLNTSNRIVHYLRTRNPLPTEKKVEQRMFG